MGMGGIGNRSVRPEATWDGLFDVRSFLVGCRESCIRVERRARSCITSLGR